MSILVESITRINLMDKTVRVWRQQNTAFSHKKKINEDLHFFAYKNSGLSVEELANEMLKLPNVNAVEVLDMNNEGVVFYSEWP